jgi:hypothetical protein
VDAVNVDALAGLVAGRSLLAVILAYAVCPYAVLWLAVRLWPKGHPRRAELLAEYDTVEVWMRPLWVGDVATRCLLGGLAARRASGREWPETRRRIVTFSELISGAALGMWMGALSEGHPLTVAGPLFVLALGPVAGVMVWVERRLRH